MRNQEIRRVICHPLGISIILLVACGFRYGWCNDNALQMQNSNPVAQEPSEWPKSSLDWKVSPVDLTFLNQAEKPAGRHGFVRAAGDSLVFEDGTPARFWGTNLSAYVLFGTSRANVKLQARRISALGFNLVRIHHFDSRWVNPNIFGKDAVDTKKLDPEALGKIDWWIKCLKDEGIYVWLDLHVGRVLKKGDGIEHFEEIDKTSRISGFRGFNYVNASVMNAMKRFNEDYLTHVNRFTGIAYKDEPAVMGMLLTNENDITHHFGNALLPDKDVPFHTRLYMDQAREFALQHDLSPDKTWRSWEPGESKLFLNDLEHRFNMAMISHLRGLGVRVPIATTSSWGHNPLYSLPALTDGDIIDVHSYGRVNELRKNPESEDSMLNWIDMGQVSGKPVSVTEWNVEPFPVADRHASPLYVASAARLQGWDAVMLYAYAQSPLNDASKPSNWHAYNDPSLISTLPAAALLYRQGHVKESDTTYAFSPDAAQLMYQNVSAENCTAARTAAERGKLEIVMPVIHELP